MKILAIDTATEACSAAVYCEGVIKENFVVAPQQHSQLIFSMIEEILKEAELSLPELDAIAFGRGPGSFTGVRIAASVAQAISFGMDLPVIPVSTLQAIAQGAYREFNAADVVVAIDARMQEVYWGKYSLGSEGLMLLNGNEAVSALDRLEVNDDRNWVVAGTGWIAYPEQVPKNLAAKIVAIYDYLPHAYDIAYLASKAYEKGDTVNPQDAIPVYLRDNIAKPKL